MHYDEPKKRVSAVVIAAWNVLSLIAEYVTLSHVYRLTPALAVKSHHAGQPLMRLSLYVTSLYFSYLVYTTLCLKKTTMTLHTITSIHINRFR